MHTYDEGIPDDEHDDHHVVLRLEQALGRALEVHNPLFARIVMEERDEEIPHVDHDLYRHDRQHETDGDYHGVVHVPPASLPIHEQIAREADEHKVDPWGGSSIHSKVCSWCTQVCTYHRE